MTDLVRIEHAAGVARLTLNRPECGNAIDIHLSRALMEAAIACDVDASVRCVLITGAGRMFCVGGDIAAFSGSGMHFSPLLKEMSGYPAHNRRCGHRRGRLARHHLRPHVHLGQRNGPAWKTACKTFQILGVNSVQ
jgi:enoyl-CoA hydratase/carnithine racemase